MISPSEPSNYVGTFTSIMKYVNALKSVNFCKLIHSTEWSWALHSTLTKQLKCVILACSEVWNIMKMKSEVEPIECNRSDAEIYASWKLSIAVSSEAAQWTIFLGTNYLLFYLLSFLYNEPKFIYSIKISVHYYYYSFLFFHCSYPK